MAKAPSTDKIGAALALLDQASEKYRTLNEARDALQQLASAVGNLNDLERAVVDLRERSALLAEKHRAAQIESAETIETLKAETSQALAAIRAGFADEKARLEQEVSTLAEAVNRRRRELSSLTEQINKANEDAVNRQKEADTRLAETKAEIEALANRLRGGG